MQPAPLRSQGLAKVAYALGGSAQKTLQSISSWRRLHWLCCRLVGLMNSRVCLYAQMKGTRRPSDFLDARNLPQCPNGPNLSHRILPRYISVSKRVNFRLHEKVKFRDGSSRRGH